MTSTPPRAPGSYQTVRLRRWPEAIDHSLGRRPGLWLLAFTILYLPAVIAGSLAKPMWFDEIFTYYIARQPHLSDLLAATRFDSHPPLSFLLSHVSQLLFGPSDLATRAPSIAAFWLLCVCLYVFVRRNSRPLFALLAATIPVTAIAYSYAFEARPYALVLGFAGLALVGWQSAANGTRRYLGLTALTLGCAAALCCHYYAIFGITFPLALGEAVRTLTRKRIDWGVWMALAMSNLPLVWLWPQAIAASALFEDHLRRSPVFWAKPTPTRLHDFYSSLLDRALLPFVIALACVAVAGMVMRLRPTEQSAGRESKSPPKYELAAAIGLLLVPVVLLIFTKLRTGYFMDRYALTAVLGVAILAAYLLSAACSWPAASVFIVAFVFSATGLRAMTVARLLVSGPGNAALIHAQGELTGLASIPGNLPVVVTSPFTFLKTARYASPETLARIIYLTDIPTAFQQVDPLGEVSLYVGRPMLPGHTEDYGQFLKEHDQFWLYYTGNPGAEWIPAKLLDAAYQLRAVKQQDIVTIFHASRGGS